MSGGGAGAGAGASSNSRVSIPKNVKTMIQNIKETVAGHHSDEEIHAMLKECSMDPNETVQKLLLLDPFHEVVKRKRDKRKEVKEILNNRESSDSRWRAGTQGRGGRGGRGSFPPRYTNDTGDGRTANAGKENGVKKGPERGVMPSSLPVTQKIESKALASVSSSLGGASNGPTNVSDDCAPEGFAGSGVNPLKTNAITDSDELVSADVPPPSILVAKISPSEVNAKHGQPTPSSDQLASPVSGHGVYSSASDPVLVPSLDSRLPGTVGTIKREVGSQRSVTDSNTSILGESRSTATVHTINHHQTNKIVSNEVTKSGLRSSITEKTSPETGNSYMSGKVQSKSQPLERNHSSESSHPLSSSTHGTSNSRPSSNYGSRSHQLIGSQKGSSKEWKPKTTNPNSPDPVTIGTCEVETITIEAGTHPLPTVSAPESEESASKLQKKFDVMHLSHNQHVIIPDHLQVPESERTGLSFGSFGANFGVKKNCNIDRDTDMSSAPISDSSQEVEEIAEEPCSSIQIESSTTAEGEFSDHPESPKNVPDNLSPVEADASNAVHEYEQAHQETAAPLGVPQYSVVHTAPSYNVGSMPSILGTPFAPFDTSESQARDASRLPTPSFLVQQPFDPSGSYLAQFYRPSADGDSRLAPFPAPGATNKYNGSLAVLSQSGQSQETGNSMVLSTAGPTPLATQAAGFMQNSLAVTQQPVPIFRQPSGVHMPHYPPNFIPYNQYFSPFYLPPQSIHHYLANPAAFPQQPPTGNVYPPPAAAAATGVKYSPSQYKPVTNVGNSAHVGLPSGYAPYSSSPTVYIPSPAASTTNTSGNEDLSASQYKENNVYITGQQSEGSAVWIPALGRDTPGLQPGSFYNVPPQGQHVTYAPTQASHGAFTGIYHPTQTMAATTVHPLLQHSQSMSGAVEMVGPPAGVYQQNRGPMNWTNNY